MVWPQTTTPIKVLGGPSIFSSLLLVNVIAKQKTLPSSSSSSLFSSSFTPQGEHAASTGALYCTCTWFFANALAPPGSSPLIPTGLVKNLLSTLNRFSRTSTLILGRDETVSQETSHHAKIL